eukprot:SAG11_NODE_15239_length_584_cov_0.962887_1_plen_22_part_01
MLSFVRRCTHTVVVTAIHASYF